MMRWPPRREGSGDLRDDVPEEVPAWHLDLYAWATYRPIRSQPHRQRYGGRTGGAVVREQLPESERAGMQADPILRPPRALHGHAAATGFARAHGEDRVLSRLQAVEV